MNIIIFLLISSVCLMSQSSLADEYVHGYTKSDGTYVQPYYRSSPDSTVQDNYSYKGNVNPYTGAVGTDYYRNNPTSAYYGTQGTSSGQGDTYVPAAYGTQQPSVVGQGDSVPQQNPYGSYVPGGAQEPSAVYQPGQDQ